MRRILWIFGLLAAVFFLSLLGIRPSSPVRATAPPAQFSAARAQDVLRRILPDERPHPTGSAEADAVRKRVLDEFTQFGYKPEVHGGFGCGAYGNCVAVNNIVARLDPPNAVPGASGAVLLACHYDSVPAGPGFSDDGVSVAAAIEIARAIKAMPPLRHPVIFLVDEGEEDGLVGARAFVDSDPWAPEVRAAVNIDARGTSGPSVMFETGSASGWAVQILNRRAVHPVASSFFYTVYKLLPSDTDFTAFKGAGYQGLNFAFLGNAMRYHTPLDDAENISASSLQHQGENALAALAGFANADLSTRSAEPAVFFDILGQRIVIWKARSSLPAAVILTVLLALAIGWLIYNERLTVTGLLWGGATWLSAILATALAALLLSLVMHFAGAAPTQWVAHPLTLEIAFWSLGFAAPWISARFFAGRAGFWGLWAGTWTFWAVLAIASGWLPGASYVALLPLIVALVSAFPAIFYKDREDLRTWCLLSPVAVAAALGFPLLLLLYPAAGLAGLVALAIGLTWLLAPLMPLEADLRTAAGSRGSILIAAPLTSLVAAALIALVMPPYSAKSPERLNLQYWEDADAGQSQWIAEPESGRLPEPIRLAASFKRLDHGAFQWNTRPSFVAGAPDLDLAPPTFTILASGAEDGRRFYRMLLRSERGAPYTAVLFPPAADLRSPRMGDQALPPQSARFRRVYNGWTIYSCPATPAAGIEMSFSLPVDQPLNVYIADESYGLPDQGLFLVHSRPLTAATSQMGDVTMVTRSLELNP